MSTETSQLEEEFARVKRELWFRGELRYMTRRGPQRNAYDFLKARDRSTSAFGPFVFNFHRRTGKTFLSLLLCIENCLKRSGRLSKLAAPSLAQAGDILDEQWPIIMAECPGELEPKPYKREKYTFKNPRWGPESRWVYSLLRLYGVKNDRGNKMRGGSTDFGVLDECREFTDLRYTWRSVLLPTFAGRVDPLALMISTLPDSLDHPFASDYLIDAKAAGRYMCVPAANDPNWTKEEDDMFAREMGGRDSPDYRREIQCEVISDASKLVIPEFARCDHEAEGAIQNPFIEADYPRPPAYTAYTMGDMGGAGAKRTDHTGIICGYADFQQGKLRIEDELFLRDHDTRSIAQMWDHKVKENYDDEIEQNCDRLLAGVKWYIDAPPQQTIDLYRLYGVNAAQVVQIERDVSRRMLRTAFAMEKISISPKCKELIYQLRNGTRKENGDFARSERLGHCDLIAALMSLWRVVDLETNPTPLPVYPRDKFIVPPSAQKHPTTGWSGYLGTRRRR